MSLPEYKALCVYYNQPTFPFLPGGVVVGTTTTSQSTQPTSEPLPSEGNNGGLGSSHSGLSSGAIAGMYVLLSHLVLMGYLCIVISYVCYF